jgi:pyruvate dehydrogenase E2 component (dihydrolipoamide acetyltransferase)
VVSLLVKEGDRVEKGQTLLELENEKAVAPIPASSAGVVASIAVKPGDRISVGQLILTLADAATPASPPPASAAPKAVAPGTSARGPAADAVRDEAESGAKEEEIPASHLPPAASPTVRHIARELGIDLRKIRGSEHGGRIVMADLRAYIERLQRLAASPRSGAPAPATAPVSPAAEPIDFSKWGPVSRKPMTSLRQTISRRMTENWSTVPHVTQFDEADITGLNELRKQFAPAYEAKGARLTLTSFVLKAAVAALKKHPIFNSSLDEAAREIVLKEYFHLGLAVDTDQGLIVPVIRDVDKKSLLELSKDVNNLAEKARARKVSLDELKGGTFTISNQGGIGGAHFTPIINKPEVAILGLGRGVLKPVVRSGRIEPRLLLPLGLSYDHRVIDGGTAARFTVDLVAEIEGFTEAGVKL